MKLNAFECMHFGVAVLPRRYFCGACGAGEWCQVDAGERTVDETTLVRHRAGAGARPEARLATAVTRAGPAVIATLDAPTARVERAQLRVKARGAIVANTQLT